MANKGGQYVIVDGKKIPRDTHQGQNKPHKTQPEKATTRPTKPSLKRPQPAPKNIPNMRIQ